MASPQTAFRSSLTGGLNTSMLVALAISAIRQNLITEPISRFMELLLFSTYIPISITHCSEYVSCNNVSIASLVDFSGKQGGATEQG